MSKNVPNLNIQKLSVRVCLTVVYTNWLIHVEDILGNSYTTLGN